MRTGEPVIPELDLTAEERTLGYQSWQLISNWAGWTKRRVESITYETATSIRRSVSVDLRLQPELFGAPVVQWGDHEMHYVPVAQLRKRRLVQFDLRDEDARALPLITKRKNATIAAAMLAAMTQTAIAARLSGGPLPIAMVDAAAIVLPSWLEQDFFRLAFLEPEPSDGKPGSFSVLNEYKAAAEQPDVEPLDQWEWNVAGGQITTAIDSPVAWRAVLGADPGFVDLAFDVARLYLIYAPIRHEPSRRRIVKYSYSEYLGDGQPTTGRGAKEWAGRRKVGRWWNSSEDWLEGIPRASAGEDEWYPPMSSTDTRPPRFRRRIGEALGWTTRVGKFETPAVRHGASYHLEISTPAGIQIRRAQLVMTDPSGRPARHRSIRGSRNLRAVDLYTSGSKYSGGNAFLNIRPESSLIIRGAAMSATFVAIGLTLLWALAPEVLAEEGKHRDAIAAALVVIPGLLVFISVRDSEHPLTTSMVFGLRVLAFFPGILAFFAAIEVLFSDPGGQFGLALFIVAWMAVAILLVAWRLAARGRPDPGVMQ
jgi:hypothetical protein